VVSTVGLCELRARHGSERVAPTTPPERPLLPSGNHGEHYADTLRGGDLWIVLDLGRIFAWMCFEMRRRVRIQALSASIETIQGERTWNTGESSGHHLPSRQKLEEIAWDLNDKYTSSLFTICNIWNHARPCWISPKASRIANDRGSSFCLQSGQARPTATSGIVSSSCTLQPEFVYACQRVSTGRRRTHRGSGL
jgi:hypothetical protein